MVYHPEFIEESLPKNIDPSALLATMLVDFVTVAADRIPERLAQTAVGPDDTQVPVDDGYVAGDPFEQDVVFPLQRLGLGQVV